MDTPERLEARVLAGEWILPGEAAALLGVGRTTVHRMIISGAIRHRRVASWRRCNPDDVRTWMFRYREERHGSDPPDQPDQPNL